MLLLPDLFRQHVQRGNAVWISHEIGQQAEFQGSQNYLSFVALDTLHLRLHNEIGEAQRLSLKRGERGSYRQSCERFRFSRFLQDCGWEL